MKTLNQTLSTFFTILCLLLSVISVSAQDYTYNRHNLGVSVGLAALGCDLKTDKNIPPLGIVANLHYGFQAFGILEWANDFSYTNLSLKEGKYGESFAANYLKVMSGFKIQFPIGKNRVLFPYASLQTGVMVMKIDQLVKSPDLFPVTAQELEWSADHWMIDFKIGMRQNLGSVSLFQEIGVSYHIPVGSNYDRLDGTDPRLDSRVGDFNANKNKVDVPFYISVGVIKSFGGGNVDRMNHLPKWPSIAEKSTAASGGGGNGSSGEKPEKVPKEKKEKGKKGNSSSSDPGEKKDYKLIE